jgi:lysylphosphatidylglycerol synthetase-like protein (DUF2156 family)
MTTWEIVSIVVAAGLAVLFIVLGVLLSRGKGAWLIAGYNTMPKEKKSQYDVTALCKFMGKIMILNAILVPATLITAVFGVLVAAYSFIALLVIMVVWAVIYTNMGNRFKVDVPPSDC